MSELEGLKTSDRGKIEIEHLKVLLEFLRPRYMRYYIPAIERSLKAQPTVKFDDIWIIMKPGTLGYFDLNGYTHGCVLDKCTRLSANPSENLKEQWSLHFWYLSVEWQSSRIGCSLTTLTISHFDGEAPISGLRLRPAGLFDSKDTGERRQRFIERGKKVFDIMVGEARYMRYDGECMDDAKQSVSKHSHNPRDRLCFSDLQFAVYRRCCHRWPP